MSIAQPLGRRSRAKHTPEGLRITVRPPRAWGQFLFLMAWLCGWAALEVFVIGALAQGIIKGFEGAGLNEKGTSVGEMLVMLAFLVLWTLFGIVPLASCVYMLVGAEVIEVDAQGLTRWFRHPLLRKRWRYEAARIRNLRARKGPARAVARSPGPLAVSPKAGSIAFHYQPAGFGQEEQAEEEAVEEEGREGDTVFIAAGVDEAEAKAIAETILTRFPALGRGGRTADASGEEQW